MTLMLARTELEEGARRFATADRGLIHLFPLEGYVMYLQLVSGHCGHVFEIPFELKR